MTLPADPPPRPAVHRKPLLGASFWAFVVFSLVCVAAGAAVAVYGPRMLMRLAERPTAVATRPLAAAPPSALPAPAPAPAVPPAPAPATAAAPDMADRLARLEETEARLADAAAAALAVAALSDAAQGSQPFADALGPLSARAPLSAELAALRPLAVSGAPSRAALAASFPDYAARAAAAGAAPAPGAGLRDQLRYALSRVVTVRRVGDVPGDDLDARLARAERAAADGDVEAALKAIDALPPAAREAMAPWRARAERRAEVDRRIVALRVHALSDLSLTTGGAR